MKEKTKNIFLTILRFVPFVICIVFMALYLFSGEELSAENLLNFAPQKPLNAAIFLVLLYAFKSLTVFFPIIVLNVLGGFLFEPMHALIINAIGVLVELTVPYWVGRLSGTKLADKLSAKYPKIGEMLGGDTGSDFFMSFFLRVISCLPGDAVSMAFGARKMPFLTCLSGSFLGTLPGMVATTLLGTSITDPSSPMFWISAGSTVGLSAISFLVYFIWRRKKQNKIAC